MILYVLRDSLHVVGVIDTWSSLIWTTKLQTAGTFELCVSATPRNKEFLQANRFLARSDIGKIMYINTIEENEDDSGKTIIVSGYSSEGILRKRMYPIWSKDYRHGGFNTMIDTFKAINPLGFRLDVSSLNDVYTAEVNTSDLQTDMETYVRFMLTREGDENLEEANFWQLPSTYVMEFDYNYPKMGMILVPVLLENIRSQPKFIFSDDIGNIKNTTYSYSEEGCASCIIALINKNSSITYQEESVDEETGETVYTQINLNWSDLVNTTDLMVYETVDGAEDYLRRNEKIIYVDPVVMPVHKRNTEQTEHRSYRPLLEDELRAGTKHAVEGQVEQYWASEEDYVYYTLDQMATLNAMKDAIKNELLLATENFQGNVTIDNLTAYNIGNIAIFRDNDRKRDYYKRIEEIQEVFDSSGYTITPTFGEALKELKDIFKLK